MFAVVSQKPAPRRALKRLLDRIRSQRNQWIDHSSRSSAADSPTVIRDQIPERDMTIETGSLISGGKDEWTSTEPQEANGSPPGNQWLSSAVRTIYININKTINIPLTVKKKVQMFITR